MTTKSAISKNQKTIKCLDLSTDCPKRKAGNPCKYCYVEANRSIGCNAKLVYETRYNGKIAKMSPETVNLLNECGGLRVFSFGDYINTPETDTDLLKAVIDAKRVGLKLKAITKQELFVRKFARYFDIINVSVDNCGDGMDWNIAKALRAEFSNVAIRTVCLKKEDLKTLNFADFHTLYHAPSNEGVRKYGFHKFTKAEAKEIGQTNRICCETGKCVSCPIKCSRKVA